MLSTSVVRSQSLVISKGTLLSFACTNPFSALSNVVNWNLPTTPPRSCLNVPAMRCRSFHLFAVFAYRRFATSEQGPRPARSCLQPINHGLAPWATCICIVYKISHMTHSWLYTVRTIIAYWASMVWPKATMMRRPKASMSSVSTGNCP